MNISTSNFKYLIFICVTVFLCTLINDVSHAVDSKLHFRSLNFSFACKANTPSNQKKYFPGVPSSFALGIAESECVDMRRQIAKVKPISVGLTHDDAVDKFEVVIYLSKTDASALRKMTLDIPKSGSPDRMLIGADNHIVIGAYLYEPFHSDVFFISADSHETAVSLGRDFVDNAVK